MATIDINALQSFSAADLLKLTEYRIAQILAGAQEYATMGRDVRHALLDDLYTRRDELKAEIALVDAGVTGGGNVLVTLGRT